ncbi:interleukin-18 receptor 1 [Latimeria chalumnae]|uniref:interleukin-18 receptor 1 n=1 Tax=Latimeria chalumnae TaxID=7897 RepID=UPI00313BAAD3
MISTIIVAVLTMSVAAMCAAFKVDIILLYRDLTGKDETEGDGKQYDAYISYLKDNHSKVTTQEEHKFAVEILPKVLEEHFGYKLCIFERDVSPGGAALDDIQSIIDKSRRLIIILSKSYVANEAMYELETGLHKALVDRKIKIIVIEYKLPKNFQSLSESLQLLKSNRTVKWEEESSHAVGSRFWKKVRYLMPVKGKRSGIQTSEQLLNLSNLEDRILI